MNRGKISHYTAPPIHPPRPPARHKEDENKQPDLGKRVLSAPIRRDEGPETVNEQYDKIAELRIKYPTMISDCKYFDSLTDLEQDWVDGAEAAAQRGESLDELVILRRFINCATEDAYRLRKEITKRACDPMVPKSVIHDDGTGTTVNQNSYVFNDPNRRADVYIS